MKSNAKIWLVLGIILLLIPPIMGYKIHHELSSTVTKTVTLDPHGFATIPLPRGTYCLRVQVESPSGATFDVLVANKENAANLAGIKTYAQATEFNIKYFPQTSYFNVTYATIQIKVTKDQGLTLVFTNPHDYSITLNIKMKFYLTKCQNVIIPSSYSSIKLSSLIGKSGNTQYHINHQTLIVLMNKTITLPPYVMDKISNFPADSCIKYNITSVGYHPVDVLVMNTVDVNNLNPNNKTLYFRYYADVSGIQVYHIENLFFVKDPKEYTLIVLNPNNYTIQVSIIILAENTSSTSTCSPPSMLKTANVFDIINVNNG